MEEPTPESKGWYRNKKGLITSEKSHITSDTADDSITDPLEDMPEFSNAFKEADEIAQKKIYGYERQLGLIHICWAEKKRVLRERYQIDWKSPAELNKHISYD